MCDLHYNTCNYLFICLFVFKDAVTEDGEILVYFPTESLKGFQPPEEWTQAVRKTHREKQQQTEG